MIPKIIHYCWFGGKPKPELAQKCMKSWEKYCPDYELMEWNEKTYDISAAPLYVRQAYEAKKWAFVTDVVRLFALYQYGGIYMDTDVEVVKPLDQFLVHAAFSGFEDETAIPTGIMAAEKGHPLIGQLLSYYDDRPFLKDGKPDLTTNVTVITKILSGRGFCPNNSLQEVAGLTLYPHDYFCPCDHKTYHITRTENTHTIHHFAGSWLTPEDAERQRYRRKKNQIENRFGTRWGAIYETLYYQKKKNGGNGIMAYLVKRVRKKDSSTERNDTGRS